MRVRTANKRAKIKHRLRVERESFIFHDRRASKLWQSGKIYKLFDSSFLRRTKKRRKQVVSDLYGLAYGMGQPKRLSQWLANASESQN